MPVTLAASASAVPQKQNDDEIHDDYNQEGVEDSIESVEWSLQQSEYSSFLNDLLIYYHIIPHDT